MRSRLFLLSALFLAFSVVVVLSLNSSQAENGETPRPLKVGVADLSFIVDKYSRKGDEETALKKVIEEANKRIQEVRKRIESFNDVIDEKLDVLSENSEEIIKLKLDRDQLKLQHEYLVKATQATLAQGKTKILASIYDDFNKVCEAYAKKFGYDMVLAKNAPSLNTNDYENLMLQISMQALYYFDAKMDVTQFILAEMNRAYEQAKNQPANGPAAPAAPAKSEPAAPAPAQPAN